MGPPKSGGGQGERGAGAPRARKQRGVVPPEATESARRRAVLAVGSNLGDRAGTLTGCMKAIGRISDTDVLAVSPVYETAPVGGPPQRDYLNAVLVVETGLRPRDLLAAARGIEADFGRVRDVRFGPRTLDIDIISYAGQVSDEPELTLPHPRAHERAFVLAPWHDVDPAAELPGRGSVQRLLAGLDRSGIRRRPDVVLPSPGCRS
ncbi:MAG: 2-amino-4-hydroxy-6-hydroxymethyldihydropteridine diphosphokinase [Streptosporangiaceae bacterium]|nr:2-amino-4-hydroxy-6-hydroxymethyldihydropteridine diphosphokinase [Streptosporangiaceae bacterium]